jgi:hypothetical protein
MYTKKLTYIIIALLLIGIFAYSINRTQEIPKFATETDVATLAWSQVKATCKVFDAGEGFERKYTNDVLGISFVYGEDAVVCERTMSGVKDGMELEVLVFEKTSFHTPTGGTGPLVVLHVDTATIDGLPNPVVIEEYVGTIGGAVATIQKARSPACPDESCPIFTLYAFSHKGHQYLLEDRTGNSALIESVILSN